MRTAPRRAGSATILPTEREEFPSRRDLVIGTDPATPVPIGTEPPPGLVTSLAAADGVAVIGHRGTGLDVLYVAVPAAPSLVARTALATDAVAVATSGSHAFAAVRGAELVVVDLAQPADPAQAAAVALPAEPTSLAVDGGLAVIGLGTDGLAVVDVTEPTAPVVLAVAPRRSWVDEASDEEMPAGEGSLAGCSSVAARRPEGLRSARYSLGAAIDQASVSPLSKPSEKISGPEAAPYQ